MNMRVRRFIAARLDRASYLGLHLTIGLAVAFAGCWSFAALLEEVLDAAALVRWDVATSQWVHAHTTPLGLRVMSVVTTLGSPPAMALLAAVGAAILIRQRQHIVLWTWLAAFIGTALLNQLLKRAVQRTRPAFGAEFLHGHSYSFPSGHSMGAFVGYAMIVYVVSSRQPRRRTLIAVTLASIVLVLSIGVSRVYLGVHYPSDVLGGFIAGASWVVVCVTGANVASGRAADPLSVRSR